uniref:HD_domain domain-containing protein n=1 Tax=Parastrongyloides trichosuri TaxID=131310 RepID=A0A0N4ZKB8_PARTI
MEFEKRKILDCIHGFIEIDYYANLIIDTKYFDRTRDIQQTGVAKIVYPSAEHSRKPHLLGTYGLAVRTLNKLKMNQSILNIDKKDIICVGIAALCHDIGHGPCSHTYDGPFMNIVNPNSNFKHERASIEIVKMIFRDYPHIKEEFDKIFNENDYTFIYECIDPPGTLVRDGEWIPKGRGIDKSFLYDIVSNIHTGIDVDKFDYFLRDTFVTNIKSSPFNTDTLDRIIDYTRVVYDPILGYKRIGYANKIMKCIASVFETRKFLFEILYMHKTCMSYEHLLVKAWVHADKYLKFKGKNGENLKLSTLYKDWDTYYKVTDSVVHTFIEFSTEKELKKSRDIYEKLHNRHIPKIVYHLKGNNLENFKEESIHKWIKEDCQGEIDDDDLVVKIRKIHSGKGINVNPMENILFYDHKKIKNAIPDGYTDIRKVEKRGGYIDAYVYADYDTDYEKKIRIIESSKHFEKAFLL